MVEGRARECGGVADKCPMTPSHVRREHWGFEDLGCLSERT